MCELTAVAQRSPRSLSRDYTRPPGWLIHSPRTLNLAWLIHTYSSLHSKPFESDTVWRFCYVSLIRSIKTGWLMGEGGYLTVASHGPLSSHPKDLAGVKLFSINKGIFSGVNIHIFQDQISNYSQCVRLNISFN